MNHLLKAFKGPAGATVLASALLFTILAGLGCGKPARPAAHVGKEWIGQPQWKTYLGEHPATSPAVALEGLVRREVAWESAQKMGLLKGEAWDDFLKQSRTGVLAKAYLAAQPGPPPFTEAQARVHFISRSEERHVVHLVCKTQDQAAAALRRIKGGESIEKAALALSIDPSKVKNSGDLGWVKREQVVQPFGDAVFTAKAGDLCGPFKTDYGWHVALVKESRSPGEEEFTKNRVRIMHEMEELNEKMKRPAVVKALRAEYPLTIDKVVLGKDRTTIAAPGDESLVAGRVGGKIISLKNLKEFLGAYLKVAGQSHGLGPETKGSFLEIMADDLRFAAAAEKAGMTKLPEVKAQLWEAEREAAFTAFSKSYLGTYKVSEAELKAYYGSHTDRFQGVGSLKLYLLVADEVQTIDRAAHEALKGMPWQKLFDKFANKASTGNWDAGWVEVGKLGKIIPAEFMKAMIERPLGTLVGPVPAPEGFMLFKVLERQPGPVQPFSECQQQVQSDYLKERGVEIVNRYLDGEGRSGIRIQLFPENLGAAK